MNRSLGASGAIARSRRKASALMSRASSNQACRQRQPPLSVLPLCSPKLTGHVERAHRTHNDEFYEVTPNRWTLPELNRQPQA